MWDYSKKMVVYEPGCGASVDIESAVVLIVDFPDSTTVRNKFLLFYKPPSLRYFATAAWTKPRHQV